MRNLAQYIDARFPQTSSVAALQALIQGIDPATGRNIVPLITPAIRLLHEDNETPLNLTNPVQPHDANNIIPGGYVRSCTIDHSLAGDVHRTLNISFTALLATQVQFLTTRVQPYIQYRDPNLIDPLTGEPQVLVEFSQGIFMFVIANRDMPSSGDVFYNVGSDLMQLSANVGFESPYVIPAGTNLVDALITHYAADKLAPSDGVYGLTPRIPSGTYPYWNDPGTTPCGCCDNPGPNVPRANIHITPNPMTAAATMPFYREANQIVFGKTIAAQLGYEDPWRLDAGLFCRPLPYSTDTPVVPEWSCDTGDTSMIKSVKQRPVDFAALRNEVTVISANNALPEPLVATRKNFSADSAISVTNLGYVKSGPPIQDDRLLTQAQVDLRAFAEINYAALSDGTIDVEMGLPIPHLTNNDAVAFNVRNKDGGLEIDSRYYPFLVTAHHLDLSPGVTPRQTITAGRLLTF